MVYNLPVWFKSFLAVVLKPVVGERLTQALNLIK